MRTHSDAQLLRQHAEFSYDGKLAWGFQTDREMVPDLAHFVEDISMAYDALERACADSSLRGRIEDA